MSTAAPRSRFGACGRQCEEHGLPEIHDLGETTADWASQLARTRGGGATRLDAARRAFDRADTKLGVAVLRADEAQGEMFHCMRLVIEEERKRTE